MRKPRTIFAAPFVLVIGCGQPQEHAATPHRHHHQSSLPDAGEVDEPIDAAIDAPVDASIDAIWNGVARCRDPRNHVTCNPPPPKPHEGMTGNPPPPSRILNEQVTGNSWVVITTAGGTDQGIDTKWKATVIDASGKAMQNGEGMIIRVSKTQTIVKVKLTIDQLANARVQFSPP